MALLSSGVVVTGRFTITKRNAKREVIEEREFKNIVLDVGYDNLIENLFRMRPFPRNLFLGTGTNEPSASDAGLQSRSPTLESKYYAGYTAEDAQYVDHPDAPNGYYTKSILHIRFEYGQGEAEGVWNELGLAYDTSYLKPFNRSLFKDEYGNATSVTILSDEYLSVTYTLEMHNSYPESFSFLDADGNTINAVASNFAKHESRYYNNWNSSPFYGVYMYSGNKAEAYLYPRNDTGSVTKANEVTSYNYDGATGTLTVNVQFDPGEEVAIDKIYLYLYNATSVIPVQYLLSSPLVKDEDSRMTFTYTQQISRMILPEEVA